MRGAGPVAPGLPATRIEIEESIIMTFSRTTGIAAFALLLTLPVAACDSGTDAEFGSLAIQLTDAAGEEIVEAWVTITDIYLQGESGESDPPQGRHYLLEGASETHELL
ncbi:MAG: hypothetical protein ACOCUW_01970, partial [Gemmatimonadota bacterium]